MDAPWIITSQRETVAYNPDTGNYAPMITITFRTANDTIASITVTPVVYNDTDQVKALINARVEQINAVANLHKAEQ